MFANDKFLVSKIQVEPIFNLVKENEGNKLVYLYSGGVNVKKKCNLTAPKFEPNNEFSSFVYFKSFGSS